MLNIRLKYIFIIISCSLLNKSSFGQELSKHGFAFFQQLLEEKDDNRKTEILTEKASKIKTINLVESTFYYTYALEVAEKNNHLKQVVKIALNLAANFEMAYSYEYAIKFYLKSNEIAASLKDTLNIGLSYFYLGNSSYLSGKHEQAITYYLEAVKIFKAQHDFTNVAVCYNNLGLLHVNSDFRNSLKYYRKAYDLDLKLGFTNALYMNNIASVYIYQGELTKAKQLLDSALLITKNNRTLAYIYSSFGEYYQAKKQYKQAEEAILKSINFHEKLSNIEELNPVVLLLSRVYEELNDYKSALSSYKQFKAIQDTLTIINDARLLQKQDFEHKLIQLEKQKDIELLYLKQKERYYFVGILVGFFLIVSMLTMYLIKKRIEAKKKVLSKENSTLKERLLVSEIEMKNKELTSKAILLEERNDLIKNASSKLNTCKTKLKKDDVIIIQEIINELNSKVSENQWEDYQQNFNHLYPSFFKNLLAEFPGLSSKDLKLCSYLKLNMSSKEIAQITHMTPNSVEVARSRLRKKLGLSNSNTSFCLFLNRF